MQLARVPGNASVSAGVGGDAYAAVPLRGDGPEGVGVDDGDLVGQRDVTGDTQPCRSSRGANPSDGVFETWKMTLHRGRITETVAIFEIRNFDFQNKVNYVIAPGK